MSVNKIKVTGAGESMLSAWRKVNDLIDAHHDKYTDAEAVSAMGAKADANPLNHDIYTDAEAVSAMGAKADANPLNHDIYTDAEAKAASVQSGAITDGVTLAPTHDAVYDVKVTADAAQTSDEVDALILTHKNIADAHHAKYTDAEVQAISINNVSEDATPDLGGELNAGAHSIGFTQQSGTGDGTTTIDWKLGNKYKHTFGTQNETFIFTAPSNPCNILLVLIQDGTGSRTVTWPATVKWPGGSAPTLTTTGSGIDIVSFYWDGTNYFGVASLAFAVPA